MTYPMLGLVATLLSIYGMIIIATAQYLSHRKTLKTVLQMQYDSVLFIKHLVDAKMAVREVDIALCEERMGVVGRRVNKLVQDNGVGIPELVNEVGK